MLCVSDADFVPLYLFFVLRQMYRSPFYRKTRLPNLSQNDIFFDFCKYYIGILYVYIQYLMLFLSFIVFFLFITYVNLSL